MWLAIRKCLLQTLVYIVPDSKWFYAFGSLLLLLALLELIFNSRDSSTDRKGRWPVNLSFGAINILLTALLPITTIAAAFWAQKQSFGLLNQFDVHLIAMLVTVLSRSFGQYVFHRLNHQIPLLWAYHQVHHSDRYFDSTTSQRFHPIELLVNIAFLIPFVLLLGMDPITLAVFEALATIYGVFAHTSLSIPGRVDRILRTVVITPALHKLHHSDYVLETDSNFGAEFSFWDRLFGTYRQESLRSEADYRAGLASVSAQDSVDFDTVAWSPIRIWMKSSLFKFDNLSPKQKL